MSKPSVLPRGPLVAAVYARKSHDQNGVSDEEKSVRRQEEHARAYAAANGWTVDDGYVYGDDGISGAEFERRPGLMRLLTEVGQKPRPPFDVLILSEKARLGRESIETGYLLKKILRAGVRVFSYLDQREITIESALDKVVESVLSAADELEREKASQRTHDALVRKARAGHVPGGRVFGYANVPVTGPDGKRQHVARQVNEVEAAVVRLIFELCAGGMGFRKIAYRLNADSAVCPVPRPGRPRAWSSTTVRDILHRRLYRGEVTWNKTAKRDAWGQKAPHARPAAEWIVVTKPELQIVSDDLWAAAHARLQCTHGAYLRATKGQRWGRPRAGWRATTPSASWQRAGSAGAACTCGRISMVGGGSASTTAWRTSPGAGSCARMATRCRWRRPTGGCWPRWRRTCCVLR